LYVAHILDLVEDKGSKLEDYSILPHFSDVFFDEVPRLPPKRDIDLPIDIVPRVAPVSKALYRMSAPKLLKLKNAIASFVVKGIHSSKCISMGRTNVICENEIWNH